MEVPRKVCLAAWPAARGGKPPWHRVAAWLGILALLIQIFVPFFHYPVRAATPEYPWDLSYFCLQSGELPPGYAPDSDDNGPSEPKDQKASPCSICKTLQQISKYISSTALPTVCSFESTVQFRVGPVTALIVNWAAFTPQPRAPPVLV